MSTDDRAPRADAGTAAPVPLHAGPLTLAFDHGDLRWLRLGDREVLRGIYVAVRTPDWATVPPVLEDVQVDSEDDRFALSFRARHRAGPVWFEWAGRAVGSAAGRVEFVMEGLARSTFLRNRIGVCVLHPAETCAGVDCTVETTDGTTQVDAFPRLVSPHQPFLRVHALRHRVSPGVEAEVRFEGEVFETEDQRNWSDASFKTYSTPLALPLPVEVREGERLRQSVTLTLRGAERTPAGRATRGWLSNGLVRVEIDTDDRRRWPRLGLTLGTAPLAPETVDRLRALAPSHLRVDVRPSAGGWRETLGRATGVAQACGTRLEVAAFVSAEGATGELTALAETVRGLGAPVDAWLVFDAATRTTTPDLVARARESLPAGVSGTPPPPLGGGTDDVFATLNRERSAAADLDFVSFSLNPQVHAFDDATLVENTASLQAMAATARVFAGDIPLALSPVTLLPPPGADPRQRAVFGAGWTLGLVAAAAAAGFGRLTLFDVQGPGGVMEDGLLYPVGQVLAELGALAASEADVRVIHARPDDRSRCLTLALQAKRLLRVYLFNATRRPLDLVVAGLPPDAWRRDLRSGRQAPVGAGRVPGEATGQRLTAGEAGHALRLGGQDVAVLDAELEEA